MAQAGSWVRHCPYSNQILGNGTGPGCETGQAGMAVGLGVDGSASDSASNLIEEVRAAFLVRRTRYGIEKVTHRDALRWTTDRPAATRAIAVGMQADLAMFTLDELRFSGILHPTAGWCVAPTAPTG
jgi:8-oxoguanine deaminase